MASIVSSSTHAIRIKKYTILEQIGAGKFGVVFKGIHEKTKEPVAIKTEPLHVSFSSLQHETTILNLLYAKTCRCIPPIYWFGKTQTQRVLVMPLYSMSLATYFTSKLFPRNSPLSVVLHLFSCMVRSLQHIHSHYVVHRDVKPHNFMVHTDELVLIDFGMATFYVDETQTHIPEPRPRKEHIVGTPTYISYYTHLGYDVVRRDEILSTCYILMYMVYAKLEWSTVYTSALPEHNVYEKTNVNHPRNICIQSQKQLNVILNYIQLHPHILGDKLIELFKYVYGLSFQEMPDYDCIVEIVSNETEISGQSYVR